MQTVVKKWFRDKNYGFLANGQGPDIFVRKNELKNCQFLKIGATVEFECHIEKNGLVAKNVKLAKSGSSGGGNQGSNRGQGGNRNQGNRSQGNQGNHGGYLEDTFRPGVMT